MKKKRFKDTVLYKGYRDILNFLYIKRTCKKHLEDEAWVENRLRVDWVGRIYTVINLTDSDLGEMEQVREAKVIMRMKPINTYLESLDMQEIVYPSIEKINDQSYLLVYSPLFYGLSWWYVIKVLGILGAGIWALTHFVF